MYINILGRFFLLLSIIGVSCEPPQSSTYTVQIKEVKDGDSFTVIWDQELKDIRVAYIDSPEHDQAFAKEAYLFTKNILENHEILVEPVTRDRYQRWVSEVYYIQNEDTLSLAEKLVENGLAWHFTQYSDDYILDSLEEEARFYKRGLWQDPSPVPPWKYRHSNPF